VGKTSLLAKFVNAVSQVAQPSEVKEVRSSTGSRGSQGIPCVVRRANGNGGMAAIRQADNDIWARAVADKEDR
jgi:hypothetical protein